MDRDTSGPQYETNGQPVVSVIVPAYNSAATIASTLDSVLGQTFLAMEVIVVDDGSTDGTAAIARGMGDDRLRVLSQNNAGQAAARNYGMAAARGQYFAFIDTDDWWTPAKLAAQVAALDAHPEAGMAYSWTVLVDDDRQPIGGRVEAPFSGRVHGLLLVTDFISSGSNALVRRDAIAQVGPFEPDLVPSEDWAMWLRIAAEFETVCVPKPHVLYRQRPSSSSDNIWRQERVSRWIIDREIARDHEQLEPHRRLILGNRYKYLLFKALDGPPSRDRGRTALRFTFAILYNDPALVKQVSLLGWILLRVLITLLFPREIAKGLIQRSPTLRSTHQLPLSQTKIPRLSPSLN